MADVTNSLAVNIRVVASDFLSGMSKVRGAVAQFGEETDAQFAKIEQRSENLSHVWKSMFEAFLGLEVVNGLKKIAEMADTASERLTVAANNAKNFGKSFNPSSMERWLKAFSSSAQSGGYSIDDMRVAVQRFTAAGLDQAQTQRAIADAANLAASGNMQFSHAMEIVLYAMTGHIDMLTRYGIISREAAKHIHTVADLMDYLEKRTAGAAVARSLNTLDGAFGQLQNSLRKLGESFGKFLIPYFLAAAHAATNLANSFNKLPDWIKKLIVDGTTLTLTLMAIVLLMPVLAKSIAFAKDGFGLLGDAISTVGKVGKLLYRILDGVVFAALRGLVSYGRQAAFAFLGLAGAEDSAIASFLAMNAPVVAVVALIAGLLAAIVYLSVNWSKSTQFMSKVWGEFVHNILDSGPTLALFFKSLGQAMVGAATHNMTELALGIANLQLLVHDKVPTLYAGVSKLGQNIAHAFAVAWSFVKGLFSGSFGKPPPIPHEGFTGVIPGKTGAQHAINDAITKAKEAIEKPVTDAAKAVAHAKNAAAAAAAALDQFSSKYENQPITPAKQAAEHKLVSAALDAESRLRAALSRQREAEIIAADRYMRLAHALPAGDKARVSHAAALEKASHAHTTKAQTLKYDIEHLALAIDKLHNARTKYDNTYNLQQYTSARQKLDEANARTKAADAARIEHQRFEAQLAKVRGETPERQSAYEAQAARLAVAAAQDEVAYYQHALVLDAEITDAKERNAKTTADQERLAAATEKLTKANDDAALAAAKANAAHSAWLDKLLSKIPGLHAAHDKQGHFTGLTFNWQEVLAQAISKSKAFSDVMKTVTEIMQLFAQIIDAFRPVIDLLLRGVIAVANGFVLLWNTIAHILSLFGIHIGYLKKLNADFAQNATPFLTIVHDIPTLNELASGNVAPLYPKGAHDTIISRWNQPLIDTMNGPSLGGGLLGVLVEILGGILALKWAFGLFGGGHGIFGSLSHLFGSHGLGGLLGKLGLHFGSGTNGTGLLGILGAFAGGALLGGFMGGLEGGGTHKDFGALGGALGIGAVGALAFGGGLAGMGSGISALLAAGPAGWALLAGGALLGGALGGLFGHADNPAQMPDKYDTATYGQELADLQGSGSGIVPIMNANGQQFQVDQATLAATGGTGMLQAIVAYIQKNGAGALGPLGSVFSGLTLGSGGISGAAGTATGGIVGGKNGLLELANGQWIDWQTLVSDAQQALAKIGDGFANLGSQVGGNISAIAGNITRFIDASTNELAGSVAQVSAATSQVVGQIAGASVARRAPGDGSSMTNHFYGDIHGYDGFEEIAQDLAEATARFERMNLWRLDRTQWGPN